MINKYDDLKIFYPKFTPVRHKRKVPFSPNFDVSEEFSARIHRIKELDFELDRFVLSEKDYAELVMDAYATNIHWSTKFEGNPLSQEEVRKVTRSTLMNGNQEVKGGPYQEIVNHIMVFVGDDILQKKWDRNLLSKMHSLLLTGTESKALIGEYRKKEADVQELDGTQVFIPCPLGSVPEEMESLLTWVNNKAPAYHPIVSATLFFHEFESIHPYEDGNGRLGRSLFHMYLLNHGLKKSNLCKIDYELLKNQALYYNLLAYTDESQDYGPLVEFFTMAVLRSYEDAFQSLSRKNLMSSTLDENYKRLIIKAKQCKEWFDLKEAGTWVDGIKEQSVRVRLSDLVEMGVLETSGRTKKLRYRFKVPFARVKEMIIQENLDVFGTEDG
jgi:Fic family protein